jgi:hypothetical protein
MHGNRVLRTFYFCTIIRRSRYQSISVVTERTTDHRLSSIPTDCTKSSELRLTLTNTTLIPGQRYLTAAATSNFIAYKR